MIVLHGTWKPPATVEERGDFFIWGESSTPARLKRRGRPRAGIPRSHPFQASKDDILKIITALDFANSGIKAKSKRGSIGDTWWSKRWVSVLESFGWSNRLERGRRYARGGQVLDFKLTPGKVTARVQGSVSTPYSVIIEIKPLTAEAWTKVTEEMAQKAIFAAKLLADEMPQNIEEAFQAVGVPLFPESSKDIKTDCSCPDSANPCKHIAAVYYILAEEFDRDPFMLFSLRGLTKEEITVSLRKKRAGDEKPQEPQKEAEKPKDVPLSANGFWGGGELDSFSVNISRPDVPAAIIKRLGTPQFWDSKEDFNKPLRLLMGGEKKKK